MKPTSDKGAEKSVGDTLEFELKWATFCKGIAQEPDTFETTLIGILPAIDVAVGVLAGQEKGPFNIPLPLWVHAQFVVKNPPGKETSTRMQFVLTFEDKSIPFEIDLKVKPEQRFSGANIRVVLQNGLPLIAGLQTLSGTFRHNGKELGAVELPISVKVTIVPKPSGV